MFNRNRACQHLRSIGISATESSRFASLINKWHKLSGPEWTVNRLKSLEQYAKDRFLGKEPDIPSTWGVTSSRKYPKRFSDDLLHELFSSSNFDLEKALNFCRLSSAISLFRIIKIKKRGRTIKKIEQLPPTKAQLRKFIDAVEGPIEPINMHLDKLGKYLCKDAKYYPKGSFMHGVVPMMYYPVSDTSAPFYDRHFKMTTDKRSIDDRTWSIDILYSHRPLMDFFVKNQRYVSQCIIGDGDKLLPLPDKTSLPFNMLAGTISPIQELGCKLRAAANPMIVLQALNEPLKVRLQRVCRSIERIVTFDQDVGRNQLYDWISSGEKVWSLDASSFTDRFPLAFQLEVLKKLLSHNVISQQMFDVFQITSAMKYWFKPINRAIEYKHGQPQGLGPSFPLATLSHYELLNALRMNLGMKSKPFMILGDDIIIKDEILAHHYLQWMRDCSVEINMQKSIISSSLGEFAGVQVTSDSIIARPKLKKLKNNDSFISWYDLHYVSRRPLKFIDFMFEEHANLTEKMSLPEDLGGRRFHMSQNHARHMLPLNQFTIVKTRLLKDLRRMISYDQGRIVKFLENKEKIRTGIINSLGPWLDYVAFEKVEEFIPEPSMLLPSFNMSALNKGMIEDYRQQLQLVLDEVLTAKTFNQLRQVASRYKITLNQYGYFTADKPPLFEYDTNTVLNKLSHESEELITDPQVLKRRKEQKSSDTSWKRHISHDMGM